MDWPDSRQSEFDGFDENTPWNSSWQPRDQYDLNDRLLTEAHDDKTAANADRLTRYEYGPGADFTSDPQSAFGGDPTTQTKKSVWDNLTGTCSESEITTDSYNLQSRMALTDVDLDGDSIIDRCEECECDDSGIRVTKTERVDSDDVGTVDTTKRPRAGKVEKINPRCNTTDTTDGYGGCSLQEGHRQGGRVRREAPHGGFEQGGGRNGCPVDWCAVTS